MLYDGLTLVSIRTVSIHGLNRLSNAPYPRTYVEIKGEIQEIDLAKLSIYLQIKQTAFS